MSYFVLILIFILAGIVPEVAGFGVATVSMVLLSFFLPLHIAIPLVATVSVITTGIISFKTKTKNVWRYVTPLLAGAVVGVPIGMFFIDFVSEDVLKKTLAIFLITYASFAIFVKTPILPSSWRLSLVTGALAGFFSASFNVHGPLVGIYATQQKSVDRYEVKDIITTFMFIVGIMTLFGHTISGRMTTEVLSLLVYAVPALLVGLFIGSKLFSKFSGSAIKKIIHVFVLVAGISLLF